MVIFRFVFVSVQFLLLSNVEFNGYQACKELKIFSFLIFIYCQGIKLYETGARFYKLNTDCAQCILVTEIYCLFNVFGYKSHASSREVSRNTLMEIELVFIPIVIFVFNNIKV